MECEPCVFLYKSLSPADNGRQPDSRYPSLPLGVKLSVLFISCCGKAAGTVIMKDKAFSNLFIRLRLKERGNQYMKVRSYVLIAVICIIAAFLFYFFRNTVSNDYVKVIVEHFPALEDTSGRDYVSADFYQRDNDSLFFIDSDENLKRLDEEGEELLQEQVTSFFVSGDEIYYTDDYGQLFLFSFSGENNRQKIESGSRIIELIGLNDNTLYGLDVNNEVVICFDTTNWKEVFSYNLKRIYKKRRIIESHCMTEQHILFMGSDGTLWDYDLEQKELDQVELPIEPVPSATCTCMLAYHGKILYSYFENECMPSKYAEGKESEDSGIYVYDFSDSGMKKISNDSAERMVLLDGELYLYDRGLFLGELRKSDSVLEDL